MRLFIVDAFAKRRFAGNQAGVALLPAGEDFPEPGFMQALAAELRHSETAFVKRLGPDRFRLRYFTPEGEVDLCGHATIAAFTVLREADGLPVGDCTALTRAGALAIQVEGEAVWMDMAPPRVLRALTDREAAAVYRAYGLPEECRPVDLPVQVVSTGLADVLLPVDSGETLAAAIQDEAEVKRLSEELDVVGVHVLPDAGDPGGGPVPELRPPLRHPGGGGHRHLQRGADLLSVPPGAGGGRGGEPLFPGGVHGETLGDPDPAAGDPVGPQGTGGRAGGAVPAV